MHKRPVVLLGLLTCLLLCWFAGQFWLETGGTTTANQEGFESDTPPTSGTVQSTESQAISRTELDRSTSERYAQGPGVSAPRLTIRVTRSDTTDPIPSLMLRLLRWDGHQPERPLARTDNSGLVVIESIAHGTVFVEPGGVQIEIAPTGTPHHELVLTPFFTVHGIVVDQAGDPITGASVLSTDISRSESVAALEQVTGADGRFSWLSWSSLTNVYASARGYSHSPVFDLFGSQTDSPGELRIGLRPTSGAVTGTVIDSAGCPIGDAEVTLQTQVPEPVASGVTCCNQEPIFKSTTFDVQKSSVTLGIPSGMTPGTKDIVRVTDTACALNSNSGKFGGMVALNERAPLLSVTPITAYWTGESSPSCREPKGPKLKTVSPTSSPRARNRMRFGWPLVRSS